MKYFAGIGLAMLVNNEIFTLFVLSILAIVFWCDVAKERFKDDT